MYAAEEYKIWRESNGGAVTATGGSGTGAEGSETTCDEGYQIVEVDGVRTCKGTRSGYCTTRSSQT